MQTAKIEALRKEGLRFREVVQRLNEERVPARRGGIWRPAQVAELLRDARPGARDTRL